MADNDNKLTNRNPGNGGVVPAEQLERRPVVAPAVDIYENRDEILVVADVPGAQSDRVTIRLEKNELYLHARRADEKPGKLQLGRQGFADYSRTFIVPTGIDGGKITAEMNAGVLQIHLPKSESLKPRQIQVRAS